MRTQSALAAGCNLSRTKAARAFAPILSGSEKASTWSGRVHPMNKQHPRAVASTDRFLVLPIVLAFSVTVITIVIPDLAPHFSEYRIFAFKSDYDLITFDLTFFLLAAALLIFLATMCFRAVRRRRPRAALSHVVAIAIIIVPALNFDRIVDELQAAKIYIFPKHFSDCAQSAEKYAKYSDAGALKICSARTHGKSIIAVVFDSGAELALPVSKRSAAFTNFLRHQIGPLLSQCDVYVRGISSGFFLVRSDCG